MVAVENNCICVNYWFGMRFQIESIIIQKNIYLKHLVNKLKNST